MNFRAFHAAGSGHTALTGAVRDCLIVDDDPVSRRSIAHHLTRLGVKVREVDAAESAFGIWRQWRPSAVLIDCVLPGGDGYGLAGSIREHERRRPGDLRSLLIAVSGQSDPAHWRRCERAGMDGALAKPARVTDVVRSLGLGGTSRAAAEPAPPSQHLELRCLYASSCGPELQTVFEALSRGHDEQVRHHAHRIAGASLVVGATEVAAAAQRLTEAVRDGLSEVELASRAAALSHAYAHWHGQNALPAALPGPCIA
ncbi:MAG: response regulator [Burkholderiaceae bacterium]|nr:response regulator [Burkholderiaceae bacterium]